MAFRCRGEYRIPITSLSSRVQLNSFESFMPSEPPAHAAPTGDPLSVWFRFVRLNRRATSAIGLILKPLGLSIPQFDVLSTLSEREGISQRELAERLYVTKGNVSGLIDRLVETELVERRAMPDDRRSHALFLTPRGRMLAEEGMAAQRRYVENTLGRLERRDLEALERIARLWRDQMREEGKHLTLNHTGEP